MCHKLLNNWRGSQNNKIDPHLYLYRHIWRCWAISPFRNSFFFPNVSYRRGSICDTRLKLVLWASRIHVCSSFSTRNLNFAPMAKTDNVHVEIFSEKIIEWFVRRVYQAGWCILCVRIPESVICFNSMHSPLFGASELCYGLFIGSFTLFDLWFVRFDIIGYCWSVLLHSWIVGVRPWLSIIKDIVLFCRLLDFMVQCIEVKQCEGILRHIS